MFCPNCGKEQVDNPRFCRHCGAKLVQEPGIQLGVQPDVQTVKAYASTVEYAGFWRRFGATVIDGILLYTPFIILFSVVPILLGEAGADEDAIIAIIYLIFIITWWLYYTLMESSSKQATLGKMALRIIVTDVEDNRISFGRANARHFSKIISGMILYIGFLMVVFTKRKQGLHDMMAGTLVVLK